MRTYKSALQEKLERSEKFHKKFPDGCTYQDLLDYRKERPTLKRWGNWVFKSSTLVLQLKAKHGGCVYEIDLEKINSCAEIVDIIFQLNHKNREPNGIYGNQSLIEDLVQAFDDIFRPQSNCCSWGREKKFSGSELAKIYSRKLKNEKQRFQHL
tara:strand:+ start:82 stop:543 length:462 start_codon:yes stop_codon:yes gene_type:complete